MLNEIGFILEVRASFWLTSHNKLVECRKKIDNFSVPKSYIKSLNYWVSNQKIMENTSYCKVKMLDGIDFVSDKKNADSIKKIAAKLLIGDKHKDVVDYCGANKIALTDWVQSSLAEKYFIDE